MLRVISNDHPPMKNDEKSYFYFDPPLCFSVLLGIFLEIISRYSYVFFLVCGCDYASSRRFCGYLEGMIYE